MSPLEFIRERRVATVVRFLLSGATNTLATFILYWALLQVLGYQAAYAISFAAGIVLSFALNTHFVFRVRFSWVNFAIFPLVYIASYAAGAVVLDAAVKHLGIDKRLAPLVSICVTLPLTFFLSRWVLTNHRSGSQSKQ